MERDRRLQDTRTAAGRGKVIRRMKWEGGSGMRCLDGNEREHFMDARSAKKKSEMQNQASCSLLFFFEVRAANSHSLVSLLIFLFADGQISLVVFFVLIFGWWSRM
jgi:hypothetical protein